MRLATETASEEPDEQGAASIAVLPLRMLSDDVRFESLADAISHEVITELSRLRWLRVIARGSSFRFRDPDVDIVEVGRILNVRYVLSGSLTLFGRKSVISLELADAQSGNVAWADSFENPLEDLLEVWREITSRVASQIESRIESHEANRASARPTASLDAWAAYFRGLWHMYRFNAHDNDTAARLFRRALELDPRFARAHAGLSFTHFQDGFVGYKRNIREQARLTREAAERAFELDPLDPLNVLTMGRADIVADRWEEAMPWLDRATELNPSYAWAFYHRALCEGVVGSGTGGIGYAQKAMSLSPIDPLYYGMLAARSLNHLGQGEDAEAAHWSARAARAPGAHVVITAMASVMSHLAGNADAAQGFSDEVRERDARFDEARFFAALPLRRPSHRERVSGALAQLGF